MLVTPSHGGNTGSNPVGDAKAYIRLENRLRIGVQPVPTQPNRRDPLNPIEADRAREGGNYGHHR